MSRNKKRSGCLGCLVWLIIFSGISVYIQYFLKQSPWFKSPQMNTTDPEYNRLMKLGYKLSRQQTCQEALSFFQKALQRQPQDSSALKASNNMRVCIANQTYSRSMNKGYRDLKSEKYATSLANFSKALKQRPNDRKALKAIKFIRYDKPMQLSLQLLKTEDYDTALVVTKTILKQYPSDVKAKNLEIVLGKTAVKYLQKTTPEAKVIPKINGKSQFYPFAIFLSSQLAKEGATDDALIIAERILREHPDDEQARQVTLKLARQVAKKYIKSSIPTK